MKKFFSKVLFKRRDGREVTVEDIAVSVILAICMVGMIMAYATE